MLPSRALVVPSSFRFRRCCCWFAPTAAYVTCSFRSYLGTATTVTVTVRGKIYTGDKTLQCALAAPLARCAARPLRRSPALSQLLVHAPLPLARWSSDWDCSVTRRRGRCRLVALPS